LISPVPAKRLPEIGGDDRADNAQDGGQDESRRLILAGVKELCDDACNEADNDGPDDAHCHFPPVGVGFGVAIYKSQNAVWFRLPACRMQIITRRA
jgi:hypothetical protein